MAQRISRAKQRIRDAGARFELPAAGERPAVVEHALYLLFSDGYPTTSGPQLLRPDLTAEAIRPARLLHRLLPSDGEATGQLALMLLADGRRAALTDPAGMIHVACRPGPQPVGPGGDRRRAGAAHAHARCRPIGQYQIQAAIAAVHDEAPTAHDTDWPQIFALYDVLDCVAPGPLVTLSRSVAVTAVHGPVAGLAALGTLDQVATQPPRPVHAC